MLGKLSFTTNFQEVQTVAKEAAETVVLVIDEEGIESLLSELLKGVADSQVHCLKFYVPSRLDSCSYTMTPVSLSILLTLVSGIN